MPNGALHLQEAKVFIPAVSSLVEQDEAASLGFGDLYVSDTRNHRLLWFVRN